MKENKIFSNKHLGIWKKQTISRHKFKIQEHKWTPDKQDQNKDWLNSGKALNSLNYKRNKDPFKNSLRNKRSKWKLSKSIEENYEYSKRIKTRLKKKKDKESVWNEM